MKLRQKLVALMAASVVVTSVPVVTMADSTNTINIYNYNIKDTTIGFKTTTGNYQTTSALYTTGTAATGYKFVATNLPGLEIAPKHTYNLGGSASNVQQTAFVHLTTDSSFQEEAYLYLIDAYKSTSAPETTSMYIDALGKIQGSNHRTWDGHTKAAVLASLATGKSNNAPFTIYFDGDGKISSTQTSTGVNITVMDVTEFTSNDRKYKSTLRLDFFGTFDSKNVYKIPFLAKVGGDKEVLVQVDGRDSFVSSMTYTLTGVLTDKKLTATSDCKTITIDNIEEIGEIRLDENQIGALKDADNKWIKVKLPSSSDLQFNLRKTESKIKATGKRGFYGDETLEGGLEVKYGKVSRNSNEDDTQVLLIKLPEFEDATSKGQVVLTGIYVEPQGKTAKTGDINVTVSEDLTRGNTVNTSTSAKLVDSTTLKVATVADYDVTVTCDPVEVKAGRSGVVNEVSTTFLVKESVKDSLVSTRKIEFTLENGYFFGPADVDTTATADTYYTTNEYKKDAKDRFLKLIDEEKIKFEEDAAAKDGNKGFELVDVEIDANGYVIGFTGYFDRLSKDSDNKIKITAPIAAPVQATGEIKVKVGNLFTRSYEENIECVVGKIVAPIEVEIENAAIKVGLQDQAAGKVTIKETAKGMIERGWMFLSAEDFQAGITFDEAPEVKVTSTDNSAIKIDNVQLSKDKKVVAFEIVKTSTEASTIEISNIKFTADRTVPEANYDLQIWGEAITDENVLDVVSTSNVLTSASHRGQYTDMYVVKDFITMTTKNTQDISSEGLKAATATFVIGENKFTVNGESVEMDSAAYIKDNYTMVPVKYVVKAFGIEGNAIQYDKATSTATIIAGNKVISITAGKAYITVNGTVVPMATKAEVKEGRMCVPMAYIAAALNVEKSWDATTKTAKFTNQAE